MDRFKVTSATLKIIALVTMLVDHVAYGILRYMPCFMANGEYHFVYILMRYIGRISFPLFAYLLVQGFLHTRSHIKYLIRLALFAILSEIPFNLAFYRTIFHIEYQNVFIVLLMGFIGMLGLRGLKKLYYLEGFRRFIKGEQVRHIFLACLGVLISCLCMLTAETVKADYGAVGVLVILVFLIFKDKPIVGAIIACGILFMDSAMEATSFLMIIPLFYYSGEKGRNIKYLSYVFYPLHLIIIYLIGLMVL